MKKYLIVTLAWMMVASAFAGGTLHFRKGSSVRFIKFATTKGSLDYYIEGKVNNASVRYSFSQLQEIQFMDKYPGGQAKVIAANGRSVLMEKTNLYVKERNGSWRNDNRLVYRHIDSLTDKETGGVVGKAQRDLKKITFR